MKGARRTWTDEQLRVAVAESLSGAQTLRKLGLVPVGGNYRTVWRHVRRLSLDVSHWTGEGWRRGKRDGFATRRQPLDEILTQHSQYTTTSHLRARLLRSGLLENQCVICGLSEWLGAPLTLHLDHVNGVHDDQRLENLRLLCPNCHSQTETYCGRNIGKAKLLVRELALGWWNRFTHPT
jgi:hypothetical protein